MIRFLTIILVLTCSCLGHEVEQHFLKIHLDESGLRGRLEMDAGYCLPELRRIEDETLPTNEWLDGIDDAGKQRILIEGEKYLRDVLHFRVNGTEFPYQLTFGKWGTDWPVYFDQRSDTFARMVWVVEASYENQSGSLDLYWNEKEEGPSLALAVVSGTRQMPLLTVSQGEEYSLAAVNSSGAEARDKAAVEVTEHAWSWLTWLREGFEHVLPKGLDHILFILGLFFLSTKWKPLLTQSLIFTIAHTITLGLTVAGKIPFNAQIVEPLIALSIAYVAIENLFFNEVKPWRMGLIFVLGLLHGMGFGSVMSELPVNKSSLIIPVLNFNLGVEIAQITVIALAFVITVYFHERKEWKVIRAICSIAIAAFGIFWTVERLLPLF